MSNNVPRSVFQAEAGIRARHVTGVQTCALPISSRQGIVSGDVLFTAGFGPQDPATGAVAESVGEQTRQVLRNLQAVLAQHGADLDDALKTTVHLADLADFDDFNSAYREYFSELFSVRTTVG